MGPQGHTTNPYRLVRSLAEYFVRQGGKMVQADVTNIETTAAGSVKVHTTGQTLMADRAVVAAGAWSPRLMTSLGLKLPVIAERGYHMTFADPGITLRHTVSEARRMVVATSMETGLRLAGTAELGEPDASPNWRRAHILRDLARDMFPQADLSKGKPWMGPRPAMPDGLPAIGPVPGAPNVLLACGHAHTGLTAAPLTGRIIAGPGCQ